MKKEQILDFASLEPVDNLDEEELAIHQELINEKYQSIDSPEMRKHYVKVKKDANKRSKAISLRLQENDYIGIKVKARELGLPYQSLINSIIHRFLVNDLDFKIKNV